MLKESLRKIGNIILTPRCILCKNEPIKSNLCVDCMAFIHDYPSHSFNIEKREYGALFYYELTIKDLIQKAKFYGGIIYALTLMDLIQRSLSNSTLITNLKNYSPELLTFVPSSPIKQLQRGLDLPAMFAHALARHLEVPLLPLLKKRLFRKALSQTTSRRDRFLAVEGSFVLKQDENKFNKILLVDDVFTTGATFDESKKILKDICSECRCLAIARTP